MAKSAVLNIRIDPTTKQEAEQLFSSFGLTVTDAVNVFLNQSLMEGGFPFEIKRPRYNVETEQTINDARNGKDVQAFDTMDEMFEELNDE